MAVGGFVVGASAMAAVIGLHNIFDNGESTSLRGSDQLPGSSGTASSNSESNHSSQVLSDEMSSTATPTAAPSFITNNSPVPTFSPTQQLETLIPTNLPTRDGEFPTEIPTTKGEQNTSGAFTSHSILRTVEVGFRLKLYWEDGYFWQEKTNEKWWCMACIDGKCEKNSKLELRDCKKRNGHDATFVATSHGEDGHRFRVANTDLCRR